MESQVPEVSGVAALEVTRELEALYGRSSLCSAGVVHVTLAARDASGRLCAVRIDPRAPRSETDFFALNLCRARADAVLTTGENVRREPRLSHQLEGPWAPALAAYRRDVLGKSQPLTCAILTGSGNLPEEHPLWRDGTSKILLTSPECAEEIASRFADRAQVVGLSALSARSACAWLREHGAALVSVEAGPSTVSGLYVEARPRARERREEPPSVDELLLTVWEDAPPDEGLLAGALPEDARLFRGLSLAASSRRVEAGHTFRFERWARG